MPFVCSMAIRATVSCCRYKHRRTPVHTGQEPSTLHRARFLMRSIHDRLETDSTCVIGVTPEPPPINCLCSLCSRSVLLCMHRDIASQRHFFMDAARGAQKIKKSIKECSCCGRSFSKFAAVRVTVRTHVTQQGRYFILAGCELEVRKRS
jgi:hypothetical protein